MLSDQELIEGLRAGLAPLQPPGDFLERLRDDAASPQRDGARRSSTPGIPRGRGRRRITAGVVGLAASGLVVAVVVAGSLMLLSHRGSQVVLSTPAVHQSTGIHGRVSPLTRGRRIHPILSGSDLAGTSFGAPRSHVMRLLSLVLGRPQRVQRVAEGCGVDETLTWPLVISAATGRPVDSEQLTVFLDRDRFVGYQYGSATLAPRGSGHLRLRATTTRGLALGDRLGGWQHFYGSAFHIRSAQGGTWKVRTATGTLRGYAYRPTTPGGVSPRSLVASIDAGNTGCPAVSP
jgi:hypothetical protein